MTENIELGQTRLSKQANNNYIDMHAYWIQDHRSTHQATTYTHTSLDTNKHRDTEARSRPDTRNKDTVGPAHYKS